MLLRSQTQTATRPVEPQKRSKRPVPPTFDDPNTTRKRREPPQRTIRAQLTTANLVRHTGQVDTSMPNNRKRNYGGTSTGTSRTKTSDPRFGQALTKNGVIHEPLFARKPTDWDDVKRDLEKSRASGSPTSEDFRSHMYKVMCSENEATLVARPFAALAKEYTSDPEKRYYPTLNQEWTEIEENSTTAGLSRPKPDFSEALAVQSYTQEVIEQLGGAIKPTAYDSAMPRFAVEMKRRGGGKGAQHQSAYDGAIMVEAARQQAQCLGHDPRAMKTEALTATYDGRILDLYANHVVESPTGLQYHQTLLTHHMLESTREDFSIGRRSLRNAQEWAYKKTSDTCDALNKKQREQTLMPSPPTSGRATPPEPSTTNAQETHSRQKRIRKPKRAKRDSQDLA